MVSVCIKCGYPELHDDDNFCPNCGRKNAPNHCANPDCPLNAQSEPQAVGPEDCFCVECGSKTTYYAEGLISPKDYSNELPF